MIVSFQYLDNALYGAQGKAQRTKQCTPQFANVERLHLYEKLICSCASYVSYVYHVIPSLYMFHGMLFLVVQSVLVFHLVCWYAGMRVSFCGGGEGRIGSYCMLSLLSLLPPGRHQWKAAPSRALTGLPRHLLAGPSSGWTSAFQWDLVKRGQFSDPKLWREPNYANFPRYSLHNTQYTKQFSISRLHFPRYTLTRSPPFQAPPPPQVPAAPLPAAPLPVPSPPPVPAVPPVPPPMPVPSASHLHCLHGLCLCRLPPVPATSTASPPPVPSPPAPPRAPSPSGAPPSGAPAPTPTPTPTQVRVPDRLPLGRRAPTSTPTPSDDGGDDDAGDSDATVDFEGDKNSSTFKL